jgi:hypothetical protein
MKIPRKIKILGHDYKVETIDWIEGARSDGTCCNATATISIDTRLPRTRQEEVFIHEIIEAINFHLELELKHPQITALASSLYSVLKEIK